jgi:sugar lactone lactonase YvrE
MTGTASAPEEIVEAGARLERLATGFAFTEGPIWHRGERQLTFSDMPGDLHAAVDAGGRHHHLPQAFQQGQRQYLRSPRPHADLRTRDEPCHAHGA